MTTDSNSDPSNQLSWGHQQLVDVGIDRSNCRNQNNIDFVTERIREFRGVGQESSALMLRDAYHELAGIVPMKESQTKIKPKPFDKSFLNRVIMPEEHVNSIMQALSQESEDKRKVLFENWGFGEGFEKGKGCIILFYGIPGTGKTMCAEMIAKYLGKDFMMLGTAELQSQIPGQMERNIQESFKQAKENKAVILFDECDSLMSNRNAVGTILAAEINCLLSEIERFEGVCVMTTNRNHRLDPALERRIALKLEFQAPDQSMRVKIWKTLIPKKCPVDKDVCFDRLSTHDLCGGNIKNIIFSAARKAVYEGRKKVRMEDFLMSLERELMGKSAFKNAGDRGLKVMPQKEISQDEISVEQSVGRDISRILTEERGESCQE